MRRTNLIQSEVSDTAAPRGGPEADLGVLATAGPSGDGQAQGTQPRRPAGKGKITNKVHSREEEYAYVTHSDLEEIADFGWFEHLLSSGGAFLAGGAFWHAAGIVT